MNQVGAIWDRVYIYNFSQILEHNLYNFVIFLSGSLPLVSQIALW